jgi:molecular chaperone DnaJ
MADLYEVLGIEPGATPEDVKRAYRRKAREHHPDAGGDEERFKEVTRAYEVLSDPVRRRRYDRFGDDGTPGSRQTADPFGFGDGGFGGIGDVIDAFFGAGFGAGRADTPRAEGGRDVLVTIELELEEVARGVEREVVVDVASTCATCTGTGDRTGAPPVRCSTCGGAGTVRRTVRTAFGQMVSAGACADCGGAGRTVADPCPECRGEGRRREQRTVSVSVPPGLEDGDRLPLRGQGEAGRLGARAGDLYVQMVIRDHPTFVRAGRDLAAELVVPLTGAALGTSVTVSGIDGLEHTIEVPAGTQPGTVLTVRRAGLPTRGGGRPGDLHLQVQVEVPRDLDAEQRRLVEALAAARGEDVATARPGRFARLRGAFPR